MQIVTCEMVSAGQRKKTRPTLFLATFFKLRTVLSALKCAPAIGHILKVAVVVNGAIASAIACRNQKAQPHRGQMQKRVAINNQRTANSKQREVSNEKGKVAGEKNHEHRAHLPFIM